MTITGRVDITAQKSTNYLILGWWSNTTSYKLSDAGVPVVKVADGTQLGYSVYALTAESSTVGASPAGSGSSQWKLVESVEFIYMQSAFIERLQAEIVTANFIQSLLIKTSKLEVLNGAKIGNMSITNGAISSSYQWQTYIGPTLIFVTSKMTLDQSGLVLTSSYGGTTDHPQVISWSCEIKPASIKMGDVEIRRDGIYINGVKKL